MSQKAERDDQRAKELYQRAMAIIEDEWRALGVPEEELERSRRADKAFSRFVEVSVPDGEMTRDDHARVWLHVSVPGRGRSRRAPLEQLLPEGGDLGTDELRDLLCRIMARGPEHAIVELTWHDEQGNVQRLTAHGYGRRPAGRAPSH